MRRLAVVLVCLAVLMLAAPHALAQKDPFDPLISEGSTTTGTTDTSAPTDTTIGTTTSIDPEAPADEPMPDTGGDPSNWIGLAVLAIALGAGLLMLGRILDPARTALAMRSGRLGEPTN
jgi:LPXTG-motif cell wall-anchored protein